MPERGRERAKDSREGGRDPTKGEMGELFVSMRRPKGLPEYEISWMQMLGRSQIGTLGRDCKNAVLNYVTEKQHDNCSMTHNCQ